MRFTDQQIDSVARGFARAVEESEYVLLACSILAEHVHMVVRRHANPGERIIGHFKARATQQLLADGMHPLIHHRDTSGEVPCAWGRRGWKVFLDSGEDIERAVRYVEENPVKQRQARQSWSFVRGLTAPNASQAMPLN